MEDTREAINSKPFRAGYVAIIGEPNVGKSTLMNTLIGQKISIVTHKPQTTRHKIIGILSGENYQVVFLDTPGLLQPKYLLHESMMNVAKSAITDADIVLFMIDCTNAVKEADTSEHDYALNKLRGLNKPVYLIINKTDLVKKNDIAVIIATHSKKLSFKEVFPISALNTTGTEELLKFVVADLPEHAAFYPSDMLSEHSERFFVSEIIREKIFEKFREEIPYSTAVEIVDFKEQPGKKDVIEAEIILERESQKGILIGKNGAALKEIGELARKDIEIFLLRPVFLTLHVKVREKWRQKKDWLKRFGYN